RRPAPPPALPPAVEAPAWPDGVERVVGFDPGLNVTGYGVVECAGGTVRLVEAGTVRSRGETLEERLFAIHAGVREVLAAFRPAAMAIEQLFVHSRFPKTAILMGHARGVICLAAAEAGLAVHNYLPTRVKSMLTGSGHAGKEQVQAAVQRELGLAGRPEPADAADALAVALADYHLRLRPLRAGWPGAVREGVRR
ncbi:MAG: crossover junction endodeoxyribonuclease RuvC, partial [Planctomycetia bacterium]|nr:crossover junction endodeoxyribonuclease RuvC [Planctomycetia bacterium]